MTTHARGLKKPGLSTRMKESITGFIMISPWLFGFFVFTIGPMIYSFYLSFWQRDFFGNGSFVGLENYKYMFTKDTLFWQSLKVTFKYVLIREPLKLIVALLLALGLNSITKASSFYRTLFYLPSVVGGSVAVAVMWRIILAKDGFLNSILSIVGISGPAYLTSINTAFSALVGTSLLGFGSSMIIFLAGLKNIPTSLYEAATTDGAGAFRKFLNITIPMLSPVIFFNVIMGIINGFQAFTSAFVMTKGGPLNTTYFYMLNLYNQTFKYYKAGYGSSLAWILFVIILFFTLLVFRSSDMWVFYESTFTQNKKAKKGRGK